MALLALLSFGHLVEEPELCETLGGVWQPLLPNLAIRLQPTAGNLHRLGQQLGLTGIVTSSYRQSPHMATIQLPYTHEKVGGSLSSHVKMSGLPLPDERKDFEANPGGRTALNLLIQ